jgi:hypothetical protein
VQERRLCNLPDVQEPRRVHRVRQPPAVVPTYIRL